MLFLQSLSKTGNGQMFRQTAIFRSRAMHTLSIYQNQWQRNHFIFQEWKEICTTSLPWTLLQVSFYILDMVTMSTELCGLHSFLLYLKRHYCNCWILLLLYNLREDNLSCTPSPPQHSFMSYWKRTFMTVQYHGNKSKYLGHESSYRQY